MEEVLHYLQLKNYYYEKFYSVTTRFHENTLKNEWNDIEFFLDNRERILNIIRSFDFKVANAFENINLKDDDVTRYRVPVKSLLDARNEWVQKIVALDIELISKIDDIKSETIKDLRRNLETTKKMSSFVSNEAMPHIEKPPKEI